MKDRDWLVIAGAAAAAWWLLSRAGAVVDAAEGILTGDNALTRGATDAQGDPVTAYEGAGVVGTAGAAANVVLGGEPASWGEELGSTLADWFDPATGEVDRLYAKGAKW